MDNTQEIQLFVKTLTGKTITLDLDANGTVYDIKIAIHKRISDIPTQQQRLVFNGLELSDDNKALHEYALCHECTIQLLLRLCGGRLHGQVFQKSLLYLRPRGFMGIQDEKLHCLMMAKLVNTRQIHLLTLVKYFYARMAIYHSPPQNMKLENFKRFRAAEMQRKPFGFPRYNNV
uniref:Ubiquitin-like domain-containing protein n=1 Tax=Elphidium margaritaceum TaxID=933848 RepID=A0A7S0XMW6_9EUKA|mmetsp:Transcript_212/g.334  ORF Transcript_212/g.334 Transcript_212/m.334 type:complete len:175 (+) Transcript_212:26-550(+)|eukprot:CAMPEP_0202695416 /NCGR_PEP_ID=MMETSP1385-20130828/9017_1 /ASSEMBLY_ACC=CAM_ASM_000861 /TAXON_ID=933848 /ORGANISM="Elphidium margaritaceum" /LENGTH=174 /DNA_ID=CAMNT_0049351437 /DNA_START=21 /DNA_END=545 /DNA_ORIENTATION=-